MTDKCIWHGEWKWTLDRRLNSEGRKLKALTPASFWPKFGNSDISVWFSSTVGPFTVQKAMKDLRSPGSNVNWYQLDWGKSSVARFSFILWLVCRRRLLTKDRLKRWGIQINADCVC
ncbi:hypothetical protein ACH5RR_003090 [Cinchona calisaya]|uniref:Reverse transcriptase zinc-binding domain-containing protein n=1 Tax=Cinchona calisaya TaxID=153742 RepID=A0ABD3ATU3_9GENT